MGNIDGFRVWEGSGEGLGFLRLHEAQDHGPVC